MLRLRTTDWKSALNSRYKQQKAEQQPEVDKTNTDTQSLLKIYKFSLMHINT